MSERLVLRQLDGILDHKLYACMITSDPKRRAWERSEAKFLGIKPSDWPGVVMAMTWLPVYWWLGFLGSLAWGVAGYGAVVLAACWKRRSKA